MFRSVFSKTLYEKRWSTLFWGLGVAAMCLMMLAFFPSFKQGGFDELFKNIPKSLQGLVGNAASYKTIPGYLSQEVFSLRVPMLTIIMSVVLFTGLIAGDEEKGTLQTLLAQPVSRSRLFLEKYLAGALLSFAVCLSVIVGVFIGLPLIHEGLGSAHLIAAILDVWLLTIVFGTISFAIGAITGKKSIAGGIAGLFAFSSYLLTSLAANVSALAPFQKFSPFHYFNNPATTINGLSSFNVLVMSMTILVLLIISIIWFRRRDIYQR